MIYLDTHVVVWLYSGQVDQLSKHAANLIERHDLLISPMVVLELSYLHETGRTTVDGTVIIPALSLDVGLKVCEHPFRPIVEQALGESWTRDPFDRLIVAHAKATKTGLITKDRLIRHHFADALW